MHINPEKMQKVTPTPEQTNKKFEIKASAESVQLIKGFIKTSNIEKSLTNFLDKPLDKYIEELAQELDRGDDFALMQKRIINILESRKNSSTNPEIH